MKNLSRVLQPSDNACASSQPRYSNYHSLFVSLGVLLLLVCPAIGIDISSSAEPMTLEVALANAYETNPQLEAQRASLRATDEEVAKALAGWRPTLSANGSYGWSQQRQTLLSAQTTNTVPQSDQLTFNQPIFDGRTIPNVRHAKALVEAGRAQLLATEQTVLGNAATAYFAVLRDTRIVEAYHDDISRLRNLEKNTQNRLRLGDLTKTDTSQASARLLGSELNLAAAEQQLTASRASFAHLVGRPAEKLVDHPLPNTPDEEDKALQIALDQNPTILQSKAETAAADYAIDTAVGALLPSLSVQAQYGKTIDQIAPGVRQNGVTVLGQLTIPIYQGGSEEAAIRETKEQRSQAAHGITESERQVSETLANSWKSLVTTHIAAELADRQAASNSTAYEGSIMESRVGARSTIDILNAEQELLLSKVTAIAQHENNAAAAYQLLSAMGKMTAKDLKLPVKFYDPKDHYDKDATRWFGLGD